MNRVSKMVPPKREILKNISLSFFPGAKIGVLGLNGAGKSTLLRIMAGVDKDFSGEARAQTGIKIGYLEQEPPLDPSKDVRGNVEDGFGRKQICFVVNDAPIGCAECLVECRIFAVKCCNIIIQQNAF